MSEESRNPNTELNDAALEGVSGGGGQVGMSTKRRTYASVAPATGKIAATPPRAGGNLSNTWKPTVT